MSLNLVLVTHGDRRYADEAMQSITWHRARGWSGPIELWTSAEVRELPADVCRQSLPPTKSRLPANIVAWYYKTWVLREKAENGAGPFCLLDSYARVLRPELVAEFVPLIERFPACLSLDPRGTLERELSLGVGISPEVRAEAGKLPRAFPVWNTGVIFGSTGPQSQRLFSCLEERSRAYLDQGVAFREQITFAQAVAETGLAPLTLPESFNVRRPMVHPCVILHTRRYGHLYGVPEVDRPQLSFERLRHRIKLALLRGLRLGTMTDQNLP